MAKETKKNEKKAAPAQDAEETAPVAGKDLGATPEGFEGTEPPAREFDTAHTFMPGQDFEQDMTLTGTFNCTRRSYSEKQVKWKTDEYGRHCRDIHEFTGLDGQRFNIWGSLGMLDNRMHEVPLGAVVSITYLGRYEVEGVIGTPHNFKILLENGKKWEKRENPVITKAPKQKPLSGGNNSQYNEENVPY